MQRPGDWNVSAPGTGVLRLVVQKFSFGCAVSHSPRPGNGCDRTVCTLEISKDVSSAARRAREISLAEPDLDFTDHLRPGVWSEQFADLQTRQFFGAGHVVNSRAVFLRQLPDRARGSPAAGLGCETRSMNSVIPCPACSNDRRSCSLNARLPDGDVPPLMEVRTTRCRGFLSTTCSAATLVSPYRCSGFGASVSL